MHYQKEIGIFKYSMTFNESLNSKIEHNDHQICKKHIKKVLLFF